MVKALIWIFIIAGFIIGMILAAAGPGTRLGWWDYGTGLLIIREGAMPALIALAASILGVVLSIFLARGLLLMALLSVGVAAVSAYVPRAVSNAFAANPVIHDVTTDFDDPPLIIAGADEDRKNPAAYLGDDVEPRSQKSVQEAQREAFPDIRPIKSSLAPREAAAKAEAVLAKMGMEITHRAQDDAQITIEAMSTSFWFGFKDDFVVRVRADGEGSVIDLRSKSRVGKSDLGANAKRVRDFTAKFE